MNINGTNTSACSRPISTTPPLTSLGLSKKTIKTYPLPHMFVVKDSVPDSTNSYAQYKSIEPWLQSDPKTVRAVNSGKKGEAAEHFQSKQDRLKLDGLYECTPRARRSTSCPSHW